MSCNYQHGLLNTVLLTETAETGTAPESIRMECLFLLFFDKL